MNTKVALPIWQVASFDDQMRSGDLRWVHDIIFPSRSILGGWPSVGNDLLGIPTSGWCHNRGKFPSHIISRLLPPIRVLLGGWPTVGNAFPDIPSRYPPGNFQKRKFDRLHNPSKYPFLESFFNLPICKIAFLGNFLFWNFLFREFWWLTSAAHIWFWQ